ncbi:hypothetical protein CR513_52253, partial [Mucuna pruriens]
MKALDNSKREIFGNYKRKPYFGTLGNPKPYKEPIKKWCEKYKWPHMLKLITKVFSHGAVDDTHDNETSFKKLRS